MSDSSLGVAVIGAGMAGRAHAAGYRTASTLYASDLPGIQLVAVADAYPGLAEATAARFGYQRAETDWRAIAAADDIDVVSIVVANHLHREIAEGLLASGKHVLCEKPMAPSAEDAEAMLVAAEKSGTQAGVGFSYRRSPAIGAIRQQVENGSLGRPLHFNGHYWCDYGVDPGAPMSWRYKGGLGSGALADVGSHVVDLAEFVCGPISAVRGAVLATVIPERAVPVGNVVGHAKAALSDVSEPVENEDLATFTAIFASGGAATFSVSRVAFGLPNGLGFELFAEKGAASFDQGRPAEFGYIDGAPGAATQGYRQVLVGPEHPYLQGGLAMDFPSVSYGQNDLFVFQARAFLEQVAGVGRLPPVPSFAHGLRSLRLLDAVTESARRSGAEVAVPAA
jgi:predicted dehydrogenase